LRRVLAALVVGASLSACGSNSSPAAPSNFTISVTSQNTNVLFGATEQMVATASDGRSVSGGTWSSDNPAVATVGTTGSVTPTGAGQATIIFTASSGQVGTKVLRGLPNLSGSFSGNYTVNNCSQTGQVALANICGSLGSQAPYTFTFTQSVDVVSGRFFLGTVEFDNISATIGLGGNLSFSGRAITGGSAIVDATWNLTASKPTTLGGTVAEEFTSTGLSGQANVNGSITTVNKTATISQRTVPQTLEDAIRAMTGR